MIGITVNPDFSGVVFEVFRYRLTIIVVLLTFKNNIINNGIKLGNGKAKNGDIPAIAEIIWQQGIQ